MGPVWRLGSCWGTGLCWVDWVRGGESSSHLYLHSEAAPYLPAEEKSPLFSVQREGIKDDGALYRLNRCVMGCPQAQQAVCCLSGCPLPGMAVAVRVSLSGTRGYPPGLHPWLRQLARTVPWGATSPCPSSAEAFTPSPTNRFSSLQPHPERLDVSFFVGGPVWAMEWCPTPEGSAAPQYVAVSCHRSMEETHSVSGLHSGPALLQLWHLGMLQTEPG